MAFEILATCPRSALGALRSGLASRRRRLTLAVALLLLGLLGEFVHQRFARRRRLRGVLSLYGSSQDQHQRQQEGKR